MIDSIHPAHLDAPGAAVPGPGPPRSGPAGEKVWGKPEKD